MQARAWVHLADLVGHWSGTRPLLQAPEPSLPPLLPQLWVQLQARGLKEVQSFLVGPQAGGGLCPRPQTAVPPGKRALVEGPGPRPPAGRAPWLT